MIGHVTFASAQYVAKYINKPQEMVPLEKMEGYQPPYNTMSRMPGLGIPWLEKYWEDIYTHDHVIMEGKQYRPPKAYDKWLEENHPDVFERIKRNRIKKMEYYVDMSEQDQQLEAKENLITWHTKERNVM